MSILYHILADIIHLFKLLLVGSIFLRFQLHKYKNNYVIYSILAFGMISASVGIYIIHNSVVGAIIYFVSIIVLFIVVYQTNKLKLVISSIWIAFIASLLDTMFKVLVDTVANISCLHLGLLEEVLVSVSSLTVILIVALVYRKKRKIEIVFLGTKELIVFTFIALAETLVVGVMASVVNEQGTDRVLFLLALCFVVIGMFVILGFVINQFTQNAILNEQKKEIEKYLEAQKNHYEYLNKKEYETRKFRHDLRSHIALIKDVVRDGNYVLLDKYLDEIDHKVEILVNKVTVYNDIADAIINHYYSIADNNGISMKVTGRFPVKCNISTYDLCTIFSNILINAIEAAQEADEKKINLICGNNENGEVFIKLSNTYNTSINRVGNRIVTTKSDREFHGFGLGNVNDCVNKYDGIIDIYILDEVFYVEIMLKDIERNGKNEDCSC